MPITQASSATLKDTMAHVASSVSIVTTLYRGAPIGVTVSSFVSLSLEPPLVLICLGTHMFMPTAIHEFGAFAVNVLSTEQRAWALRFAGMLPDVDERFAGIAVQNAANGSPMLPGCVAWLECDVWTSYSGGDHTIIVGAVRCTTAQPDRQPLLRYNRQWCRSVALPAS